MRHASRSRERIDTTIYYETFLQINILNIIIVRIRPDISNFKFNQCFVIKNVPVLATAEF